LDRFGHHGCGAVSNIRPQLGLGTVLRHGRALHFARRTNFDLPAAVAVSARFGGIFCSLGIPATDPAKIALVRGGASAPWSSSFA